MPENKPTAEEARLKILVEELRKDRDYLWQKLAHIEAWIGTAPQDNAVPRVKALVKAALDEFKPTIEVTRSKP